MKSPEFNSIQEAHDSIKTQLISLCDQYSTTIKELLPSLKKAIDHSSKLPSEPFKDAFNEGHDHLHNLAQLKLELNNLKNAKENLIIEISAEVIANTVTYLNDVPSKLSLLDSNT